MIQFFSKETIVFPSSLEHVNIRELAWCSSLDSSLSPIFVKDLVDTGLSKEAQACYKRQSKAEYICQCGGKPAAVKIRDMSRVEVLQLGRSSKICVHLVCFFSVDS